MKIRYSECFQSMHSGKILVFVRSCDEYVFVALGVAISIWYVDFGIINLSDKPCWDHVDAWDIFHLSNKVMLVPRWFCDPMGHPGLEPEGAQDSSGEHRVWSRVPRRLEPWLQGVHPSYSEREPHRCLQNWEEERWHYRLCCAGHHIRQGKSVSIYKSHSAGGIFKKSVLFSWRLERLKSAMIRLACPILHFCRAN